MDSTQRAMTTEQPTTMASSSGVFVHLPEFSPEKGDFDVYVQRFEAFATANKIEKATKQQAFLALIGEAAFITLQNLLFPKTPAEASFEDVVKTLRKHYTPKRSVVVERYKFYRRDQRPGEGIGDFVVELKKMAATCNFGTFLEEAIRDRFIVGLHNDAIRCKLLATEDHYLTFEKAYSSALGMEAAQAQSKEVRSNDTAGSASAMEDVCWQRKSAASGKKNFPPPRTPVACTRCGSAHGGKKCPHLASKCYKCSKTGHLAKMCRTNIRSVTSVDASTDETVLFKVETTPKLGAYFVITIVIDGKQVDMQVDTGAAVSIMSESEFRKMFPHKQCQKTNVRLTAYNGSSIPVIGRVQVSVTYEGKDHTLPLIIARDVKGLVMPNLLGRDWLSQVRLNWKQVTSVNTVTTELSLKQKYGGVFEKGFGVIKGFKGSLVLKETAQPIFCKARPVPYALHGSVETELKSLEKAHVIYRVPHSDWATPLVTVLKDDKSVRLCGDYRVTVNPHLKIDHYPLPLPEDIFATLAGGTVFTVLDLSKAYLQLELD